MAAWADLAGFASARRPDHGALLGTIGGVELRLHRAWWLLPVAAAAPLVIVASDPLGLSLPDTWVLALGLSLSQTWVLSLGFALAIVAICLVHEAGHVLAGARLGLEPATIELLWLGAAVVHRRSAATPRQKALSAAAGPAASVLAAGVIAVAALVIATPIAQVVGLGFAALSLAYGLLNLLPAYPQDGGQLLHALLWHFLGDEGLALRFVAIAGLGLAALTGVASIYVWAQLLPISGVLLAAQALFVGLASARVLAVGRAS